MARQRSTGGAGGKGQRQLREWWGRAVDLKNRGDDCAVHIIREHNKEADAWAGKGARGREEEWVDGRDFVWSDVTAVLGRRGTP